MCSNYSMERRGHWWNGRWGRLGRHDIYLHVDGDRWYVEDRLGGADGSSTWFDLDEEDVALERVRTQMSTGEEWRQLG